MFFFDVMFDVLAQHTNLRIEHFAIRQYTFVSFGADGKTVVAAGGLFGEGILVWDPATLERYIADPEALVPGTRMSAPPLRDEQERADLVAYLARPGQR